MSPKMWRPGARQVRGGSFMGNSPHTRRLPLAVIFVIVAGSLIAQQPNGTGPGQGQTPVSIPFVGCPSDGQAGPVEAPNSASISASLSLKMARELAYYSSSSAPGAGVLGPRGWHCFGTYGSGGSSLFVSPQSFDAGDISSRSWSGFRGPAMELIGRNGGGSGMSSVAQIVARVFPAYKWYALNYVRDFDQKLAFGPYPNDLLAYKSDSIAAFTTLHKRTVWEPNSHLKEIAAQFTESRSLIATPSTWSSYRSGSHPIWPGLRQPSSVKWSMMRFALLGRKALGRIGSKGAA